MQAQSFGQAGQRNGPVGVVDSGKFQRGTTAINHKNMVGHHAHPLFETWMAVLVFGHKRAKTGSRCAVEDRLPELCIARGCCVCNKILGPFDCRKFVQKTSATPGRSRAKWQNRLFFAQFSPGKNACPHPDFRGQSPAFLTAVWRVRLQVFLIAFYRKLVWRDSAGLDSSTFVGIGNNV